MGKEAFITALSDGNLQLEVMKHKPLNIEAALSYAIKVEAYEQSLVCQGTVAYDCDDSQAKRRSHNMYAVSDKSDAGKNATLRKRVEQLSYPPFPFLGEGEEGPPGESTHEVAPSVVVGVYMLNVNSNICLVTYMTFC